MMNNENYALFRFPYEDKFTTIRQTSGKPLELKSYSELGGKSGFVFAPFSISDKHPLLLLRADEIKTEPVALNGDMPDNALPVNDDSNGRKNYENVFSLFHSKLESDEFSKIILSRCKVENTPKSLRPKQLFMRACNMYPRMFVALVSMHRCGTWLMATPEILLENCGERWHTMAIAGTMRLNRENDTDKSLALRRNSGNINEWDTKNIQEQRYVSRYIAECLGRYSSDINEVGPYTLRAGMVKHLATDFNFKLDSGENILGQLIEELHPTPAVCGIPKDEAYAFIQANESYDRSYYSGFSGPLNCAHGSHLYVTLRCMRIETAQCVLYAGGGLLKDSEVNKEWLETEAKMETMRRCL